MKITTASQLHEAILLMEIKQKDEQILLKEQFKQTYDSLKPVSIIKDSLNELLNLSNLKEEIIDTSISVAVGYLSKKLVFGSTDSNFKQFLGSLLQVGVTSIVSQNTDSIRSFASRILSNISAQNNNPS